MKKSKLLFLTLLLAVTSCSSPLVAKADDRKEIDFSTLEDNDYHPYPENNNPLGDFDLISPTNMKTLDTLEQFSWEACENADKYTFELCSSDLFVKDNEMIDYYAVDNINATTWNVTTTLAFKDTNYYWRVTAYNNTGEKQSTSTYSFFVRAPEVAEVPFDLGDADDWQLHPLGSYADISIDNNNFFGNNEESVVVSFKKEDTSRGVSESDGWVIVTKTIEKTIYGTDALLFNLFYAGQDATLKIRLVDRDNEYWECFVQVSNNAKQQIILKFSDFFQRTADVTVANGVFDYERIKYFEIVFERSFGDGVLLLSGVKAIKFDNYRSWFIEKLNYADYNNANWSYEGYNFDRTINNTELTLQYYNTTEGGKSKIGGYGFAKLAVNKYFYTGDAIKVKVKRTGGNGTNAVIRVYEEDTDRWFYRIPFADLSDEYKEFIIPFKAFDKSSILGDGKRQFYYIINLQFGLEGQYNAGTLSFKDFEIVEMADYKKEDKRLVGSDGLIENFSTYDYSSDLYFIWETSVANKDEFIMLDTDHKIGGAMNEYCGRFDYKSDMAPAQYTIPVKTEEESFSSLTIWMKDASVKSEDARFSHVKTFSADVSIYISLLTDEIYVYHLGNIDRVWTEYNIPFSLFELTNEDDVTHVPLAISSIGIKDITLSFQYFYYSSTGTPVPLYTISNPVYVDDISFAKDSEFAKYAKEKIVEMDGDEAVVETFEDYRDNDDLYENWLDGRNYDYQKKELSDVVSKEGGNHSMAMQLKAGAESPAYYIAPVLAEGVKARGIRFSLYSEKAAQIFVNLYIRINTTDIQYRATIGAIETSWYEYAIGFDLSNFAVVSGTNRTLSANDMMFVTRISFGMTYSDGTSSLYNVYLDNLILDYSLDYMQNTKRAIE